MSYESGANFQNKLRRMGSSPSVEQLLLVFFTLFTSDEAGLRTGSSARAGPVPISVAKDLFRQDSSSLLHFVCRATFGNSRDLSKKGSAAAQVGVRHADREQGDRSVHAIKEPSPWRTRHEIRAKNEGLHYMRTKSSTDGKLAQVRATRSRLNDRSHSKA
jgi:hypothetical protein